MSDPIKVGDMVQVVWGCCSGMRLNNIGWTGTVKDIGPASWCRACCCGYLPKSQIAEIDIYESENTGVPLQWLIRINPPPIEGETNVEKEITA